MQVPLIFTYPVEYMKVRARTAARESFVSETSVTLDEVSSAEAPVAIHVERPSRAGPDRHEEFVLHDGRLFRALRRPDTGAVIDIDSWRTDLMDPAGSHTLKKNGTRDILKLRPHGQHIGHQPVRRPEDVEIAKMISDGRDKTLQDIGTAAAGVIIRDGKVFHGTTEPFWLVRAPHTTADAKLKRISLDIVDLRESWEMIPVNDIPFMEYYKFRLDRFDEAMNCWSGLASRLSPAKIQPYGSFDTFSSDGYAFRFDDAGAMMFELLDDLSGSASLAVTCVDMENRFKGASGRPAVTLESMVHKIAGLGWRGTRPTAADEVAGKLRWIADNGIKGWPIPTHHFFEMKAARCLSLIPAALEAYEKSRNNPLATRAP